MALEDRRQKQGDEALHSPTLAGLHKQRPGCMLFSSHSRGGVLSQGCHILTCMRPLTHDCKWFWHSFSQVCPEPWCSMENVPTVSSLPAASPEPQPDRCSFGKGQGACLETSLSLESQLLAPAVACCFLHITSPPLFPPEPQHSECGPLVASCMEEARSRLQSCSSSSRMLTSLTVCKNTSP